MTTTKKDLSLFTTVNTIIKSVLILVTLLCFSGCEDKSQKPSSPKYYNNTTWLEMNGSVSKGYAPYMEVNYRTYTKACEIKKNKGFFDHLFIYLITRLVPVENALYTARSKKEVYDAKLSKNGTSYTIKYPNNFRLDDCRYDIESAWFKIKHKEQTLDEKNSTIEGNVFHYYFIHTRDDYDEREHNMSGNYCCKNDIYKNSETLVHKKILTCEKKGRSLTYEFLRDLYTTNSLTKEKNITVNISMQSLQQNFKNGRK